ncbi:MAG TPA: FAD-dependent monooxygenase [Bauldia sp.]|nr:FAD-dependent monooxygenase [Bauldia sp.]
MGERPIIIVAGAGIGGLTAALAIADAGFRVIVIERSSELLEIGAGIQLSPNAGRVLAGLGLDVAIAASALEPQAIAVRNGLSGATILSIPAAEFETRYGFPYRVIHRAELQAVLSGAVRRRSDIRLILGTRIEDVLARGDSLFVRTRGNEGSEVLTAAGIVGADGVWSETRSRVAGARPSVATGRTAWRTVIPVDNAPPSLAIDRVGLWLGPKAHLVHYPVARGAAINVVAIIEESFDKPGWAAHANYRWMAERFRDWCGEVRALVSAPSPWQKFAINVVDPGGRWTEGRIALLGDAAHAMVPFLAQGAAMAIEDAAILGRTLAATADDVPAAFAAYEADRKPRVTKVWKAARRTGDHYHQTGLIAAARDFILRTAGPQLVLRRNDWIYGWQDRLAG